MAKRLAKRFYKSVTVDHGDDGWHVLLDGRQLRTPGKVKLSLPNQALAQIVAGEWEAQAEAINPSDMPVTRLVNVAFEQTPGRRQDLIDEAVRYAGTDLICYRAPQPRILRERQAESWDRWRDWAAEQGIHLFITEDLSAIAQPESSLDAVATYASDYDDLRLTLFVHLIAVFGSVVLAMAVMEGELDPNTAFDLSRVDHDYQNELWGQDEEQAEIDASLRIETVTLGGLRERLK